MTISSFLIVILTSLASAYFSFVFALRLQHRQRIWERREQAYVEIVSALHDIVKYCGVQKNDYGQGIDISKEQEIELFNNYIDASQKLSNAMDLGLLYMSENAYQVLRDLQQKPMLNPNQEPWFEVYYDEHEKHEHARKELIRVAQHELHLNYKQSASSQIKYIIKKLYSGLNKTCFFKHKKL